MVVERGVLSGVSEVVRRQRRRRRGRHRRGDGASGPPRATGGRRDLAQSGHRLPDGRPRLRRRRPARHRPAVRRDGRDRTADRRGAPAGHQDHHGRGAQPHQLGASVVPGGAGRRTGFRRPAALLLPGRPRRGRRAAAEQLDLGVRRVGLDPGARTRRQSRPVVSAPVRHRAARPELGAPGRLRRLREDAAVLAGARRGRLPHRRGARHGQTGRPAGFAGPRVQGVAPQRRRPALQPPERARHPPRHPQGGQRLPRRGDRRRGVGHRQRPLGGVPAARRTASGVQLPADQDRLRRRPDPRRDPELAGRHRPAGGHPDLDAVQPRRRPGGHPLRRRRGRAAPGPCDGDGDARPARRGVHLQRRGAGPARRRVARRGVAGPDLGALGTHRAGPGQMPGADALVGPGSPVRVLLAHRHLAADAEGVGGADRAKAARRPRLDVVVLPAGPRIAKAPCGIRRRRRRIGWRRPPMR